MRPINLLPAFLLAGGYSTSAVTPEARLEEKHFALLETYCLDCHDGDTQKGKVDLEALPFHITTIGQAELWQKVLNAMNSGEMPPEDKKQPENSAKADFLDDLANTQVIAREALSDTGGKITMRRLNRREYQNTIGYLTGVTLDASSLPSDGGGGTFDTVGASQFISSDQFEQYLKLGRTAIDEWFERRAAAGYKPKVFRVEPENTVNVQSRKNMETQEETYGRYLLWKAGVDKAAKLPENAGVLAQIQKKYKLKELTDNVRLYQNANLLSRVPDAKEFGFRDANQASFSYQGGYNRTYAYMKHYLELPHSDRGTYLKLVWAIQRIDVLPKPKDVPPGTYKIRIRAGTVEGSDPSRQFIEIGHPQRVNQVPAGFSSLPIASLQVTGTVDNTEVIETTVEIGAETPREFGIQERQPKDKKSLRDAYNRYKRENGYGTPPAIWVDWIELEGPLAASSGGDDNSDWWVSAESVPDESARARLIFQKFATKAFRDAKPGNDFLDRLVAIFKTRQASGDEFNVAVRTPLSVILASPAFLYLSEPGDEKERRTLTDRELAVRLAYFLWSAPPDQELLSLAKKGELHKPAVLRQQTGRLLADTRSDEFVSGFVHQWLDMERLDFFQFDVQLHGEFDESTRSASRQEVYQSFTHLLRDAKGGRLGKLLKADYVFINGLLANYYGIDGVTGDQFRKVVVPAGSPRGGLLGMAAIHAMGSDGVNSSPVERGAWIMRYLLNTPPPPAPANVPQLSRLADKPITARERLLAHQEEAQCASCHRKIDPIGFGLENFDAASKWRTTEHHLTKSRNGKNWTKGKSWEIDASGGIFNGPKFDG